MHDLNIVLLERLRSDSSLVTHGTDSLQDDWEFGLKVAAFQHLPQCLGETQLNKQFQQTERTGVCCRSQNLKACHCIVASLFGVSVRDDLTRLVSLAYCEEH